MTAHTTFPCVSSSDCEVKKSLTGIGAIRQNTMQRKKGQVESDLTFLTKVPPTENLNAGFIWRNRLYQHRWSLPPCVEHKPPDPKP